MHERANCRVEINLDPGFALLPVVDCKILEAAVRQQSDLEGPPIRVPLELNATPRDRTDERNWRVRASSQRECPRCGGHCLWVNRQTAVAIPVPLEMGEFGKPLRTESERLA